MNKRRIKINYMKVNLDQVVAWLELNEYKYALIPYESRPRDIVGSLLMFVEVYTAEAETALRLTWNCE